MVVVRQYPIVESQAQLGGRHVIAGVRRQLFKLTPQIIGKCALLRRPERADLPVRASHCIFRQQRTQHRERLPIPYFA